MSHKGFALHLPPELLDGLVEEVTARVLAQLAEREADGDAWPEWMSVETAARYLDVSEERVRKLKDRREIPHYQEAPGCRVFFRRSDLDEWMGGFRQGESRGRL